MESLPFMHNGERLNLSQVTASHYKPSKTSLPTIKDEAPGTPPPYLVLWLESGRKIVITSPALIEELLPHL